MKLRSTGGFCLSRVGITLGVGLAVSFPVSGQDMTGGSDPFTPFQTILIGASGESAQQALRLKDTMVETWRFDLPEAGASGGVNVALGDVDGDGNADIVTGAGAGGSPVVSVFSQSDGLRIASFLAFDSGFQGGVYVATGDVNGDGTDDIIAGAGAGGGPHVKVFDGTSGSVLMSFFAYAPTFAGGVRVAAGDVNGDGKADVITGAGPGGGPHVKVFNGSDGAELASFFAFDSGFSGGIFVGGGQIDGEGNDDIVVGGGDAAGPHIRVFDGTGFEEVAAFSPFSGAPGSGARVSVGVIDGSGKPGIITSPDDDRNLVRVFDCEGAPDFGFRADVATRSGGVHPAAGVSAGGDPLFVFGNGSGGAPVATVFEINRDQLPIVPFFAGFTQGISVAMGDHTGDAVPDVIVGSGPGLSSSVIVYDGTTGGQFGGFLPYGSTFNGGVEVCAGDFDGDGRSEIVTGPGPGVPQEVRVFDGNTVQVVSSFFAFGDEFTGGVRVATGDVNGDGTPDIIAGAGADDDEGPRVKVFDGSTLGEIHSFFAYDSGFTGGVFVSAGDVNGDGIADIITGPGNSMGPIVKVFDGVSATELVSFPAFDPGYTGGVHVAGGDVTGDGVDDIVVSPSGNGPGEVRVFGNMGAELISLIPGLPEEGFPVAVVDRPTPNVELTGISITASGAVQAVLQGTRGMYLHLDSCSDLRGWKNVTSTLSDGTEATLEDSGAIGQDVWFVRGRAR